MRLNLINELVKNLNVNIVIVGYRGYGPSEGIPTESGIKLDGEAIMKYVLVDMRNKIDTNNVFIMGRSLGGAVAINTQGIYKFSIKGLILENTFLSIGDLVDRLFPIVKPLKNILLNNHWESKKLIGNIKVPIFFIMSDRDELVPFEHMLKLKSLSENNSKFIKSVSKIINLSLKAYYIWCGT
jgi:pimeloyl-ACP methyl ester carboxylesterase